MHYYGVISLMHLKQSKSDLHQPLFDLIKQVRLFSRPWYEKRHALLQLEQDYHR